MTNKELPKQNDINSEVTEPKDFDGITFEIEEVELVAGNETVQRKGVFLIPNMVTTIAFACGFFSIVQSTSGNYLMAVYAIIAAAFFDGMDGRLARAFNAHSKFGEQFDSLSDLVSFGVAPAILVYSWILEPLGRIGLGCAILFAVCAAFRLARFNVQIGSVDSRYFIGLASPLAAGTLTSAVLVGLYHPEFVALNNVYFQIAFAVVTAGIGLLMISNIRYWSFKQLDKRRVPFALMLPVLLVLLMISYDIPIGLLGVCVSYIVVGFLAAVYRRFIVSTPA